MSENILRVSVWPASVRLLHLIMAATCLILLLTGSLLQSGMILNLKLSSHLLEVWHLPAGHVFAIALLIRIIMLIVSKGVAGIRALTEWDLQGVVATAVFYISFARMNLPGYFAHNPLWKILYLLFFILSVIQSFSGFMLESNWLQTVVRSDSLTAMHLHQLLFLPLGVIVVAHVVTVILHDWKSNNGEISAIVNGYKFFTVEQQNADINKISSVKVSLDSLTNKKPD